MKKILALLVVAFLVAQTLIAQPKVMSATEEAKFSIVYELNGGTNDIANPEEYTENATVKLKKPTREGYSFGGWYWDAEFKNRLQDSAISQKTGTLKIYAKWTLKIDSSKFEAENMVEIIPAGQKVLLENFAGTKGVQNIFGYSISKYEVTQELFYSIMKFNPSEFKKGADAETRPVERVTWYDAVYFCNELTKKTMSQSDCCYTITNIKKRDDGHIDSATVTRDESKKGYRLPTEAEWEMAARGGTKGGWDYKYAGSDEIDEVAWYDVNSDYTTHKVGTKKPNAAGLYDMSGNVSEWCDNLYKEGDSRRVNCGGSYNDYKYSDEFLVSHCSSEYPDFYFRKSYIGFRVCRSL